jgi:hypothetical protein
VGDYAIALNTLAINDGNSGNNYAVTYSGANLTIGQRAITLAASAITKYYASTEPALSVSITGGSLGSVTVNDTLADVTGTLTRESGEAVGTYDIALGTGAKAANYAITFNADNDSFIISNPTPASTPSTTTTTDTTTTTPPVIIIPPGGNSATDSGGPSSYGSGTGSSGSNPFAPPSIFDTTTGSDSSSSATSGTSTATGDSTTSGVFTALPASAVDLGGGLAIQLGTSGGSVTLSMEGTIDAARAEIIAGVQGGVITGSTEILLLTVGAGGGLVATGTLSVVEQGQVLKATPSSAEVSSIPQIDRAGLRTVTVDYTLPNATIESISVSISLEGVLLISIPQGMRDAVDERHIILIGIAIAKQRLAVDVENVKGVLFEMR